MAKSPKSATGSKSKHRLPSPGDVEVLLDVELVGGALWLVLANPSDQTAFNVSVVFRSPLLGIGGERDIARMSVFRALPLLRPKREIRVLVDVARELFARGESTRVEARVDWQSRAGDQFSQTFNHDLAVWKDFGEVI
jgi:hypothetical protein